MKTLSPKKNEIERKWYLVDAKGKTLGRMASKIAAILRGKNKSYFVPHMDCGDFVVIINAQDVHTTGMKKEQKMYYTHSGQYGKLKSTTLKKMLDEKPEKVVKLAITGMLPNNKIRKQILMKLKIYAGPEHKHEAQNPELLKI
ncbi:50S ribosomal protein L13 [Candidatus Peregrinibacteria bacterium]|nr:50S ribosomal protein L13 [Candidatus Peregrinibacteria bacterium]